MLRTNVGSCIINRKFGKQIVEYNKPLPSCKKMWFCKGGPLY